MDDKKIIDLIKELRKQSKQNLINKDWYGITDEDIDIECINILKHFEYGK